MTTQCKLCGRDINPHDLSSWKEVTGFVGGPKKDSMVLRTDTGAYACTPCIHKAKEGQAPDQPSMLEDDDTLRYEGLCEFCDAKLAPSEVMPHLIAKHGKPNPDEEMFA